MLETLFFQGSLLAAFLGGMVALFAPCCVTFMLPAYLAATFKVRYRVIFMTLIFTLGVATVILPIALGLSALAQLFNQYHLLTFLLGSFLLFVLGVFSWQGKNLMFNIRMPQIKHFSIPSVYLLGLFAGAASSCCAPVLAGVLTLSALSQNFLQAGLISLAYIFGMVFPLFLSALFLGKLRMQEWPILKGKMLDIHLWNIDWKIHSTNLVLGLIFFAMGFMTLWVAFWGQGFMGGVLTSLAGPIRFVAYSIIQLSSRIPNFVWLIIFILTIVGIARLLYQEKQNSISEQQPIRRKEKR